MNKKIFAGAIFMLCSTLTIAGCNSTPNKQGNFEKKEYIFSVDNRHDFLSDLTLKGGQKSDVTLVSSSPEIIENVGDGVFVAKASGSAIIEAKLAGKTIASCKVVVKYKLALPQNFVFSQETGTLTWDKSFALISGKEIYANQYAISYTENPRDAGQTIGTANLNTLASNKYTFSQKGSYKVKVKAQRVKENLVGVETAEIESTDEAKYIDESGFCQEFIVNYGLMGEVENFRVEKDEDVSKEEVIIKWAEKSNALYDVYLQGFLVQENLTEAQYTLDYKAGGAVKIDEGQSVEVKIVSKDKDGLVEATETTKVITRLTRPTISYQNNSDSTNGQIVVAGNGDGEKGLRIFDADGVKIKDTTKLDGVFNDFAEGIYQLQGFAVGNALQLNSALTDKLYIAKLATPRAEIEIVGHNANITVEQAEYVKRYLVECNGKSEIITISESNTYTLNLDTYGVTNAGDYDIFITALPTLDNQGQITAFSYKGLTTANVINSNSAVCSFKVLEQFGEVRHYMEEGKNKFKFDSIEGATDYIISVNGATLGENDYTLADAGDKKLLIINNLKGFALNENDEYEIEVKAERVENGVIKAIESKITKKLKVLVPATASQNIDGTFTINKISQTDQYYYEIFKTDSDYVVSSGATPDYARTIYSGNKTLDKLAGGYYKIRIYTKSSDINEYLDANFVLADRYFEADFLVTQRLEAPKISFDAQSNTLTIERVEFGGGYDIYVDGVLNGSLDLLTDAKTANYSFPAGSFSQAKAYAITVKAKSGTMFDSSIYLESALSNSLTITKLATPDFTVTEKFDNFGKKIGETLEISREQNGNAQSVQYVYNGDVLDEQGYSMDIFKLEYGNTFTIKTKFIARPSQGDNYYLDSDECVCSFNRIASPTNIEYNNGLITFTGTSEASGYYATLSLVGSDGTQYIGLNLGTDTTIDLQTKLNLILAMYPAFASAYEKADYYEVELYSVSDSSNKYKLSSFNGTAIDGQEKLVINKLSGSTLSFDKETKTLSWTQVESGSTYDIYAGNTKILSGLTSLSVSLDNSAFTDDILLNGTEIRIKSNNPKYLGSKFSNEIYIQKLASAQRISVSTDGVVTIFLDQSVNTSKVLNGTEEMSYTAGNRSISKTLTQNETLEITFVGKDSADKFYLDSDKSIFKLIKFEKPEITKTGNTLSWQDISLGQSGVDENRIIYTLTVSDQGRNWEYQTSERSVDITELENLINTTFDSGELKISVSAELSAGYSLSNGGTGYFGKAVSEEITITKFDALSGQSSIIYGNDGNEYQKKLSSKVEIEFEDKWTYASGVKFEINNMIKSGGAYISTGQTQVVLGEGDTSMYMSLAKKNGKYVLTIDNNYFSKAGEYRVDINVTSEGYINSNKAGVFVEKLKSISSLSVADDGKVTLTDRNNFNGSIAKVSGAKHIVMLSIGGKNEVKVLTVGEELNLKDFAIWQDAYGSYTLSAICYDSENKVMPSADEVSAKGTKLEGIESISTDTSGVMTVKVITVVDDMVFTGRIDGVEKDLPLEREEETNEYTITLAQLAQIFNITNDGDYQIEIAVKKIGSVDSDFESAGFAIGTQDKYYLVKDENYVNTYLIFEKTADDTSVAFQISVGERVIELKASSFFVTQGYVNYNLDGDSKVDLTFSQSRGTNYFRCYAVNLDTILALGGADYGSFSFNITRISKSGSLIKQNNKEKIKAVKLNTITIDATSEKEYLRVDDSILRFGFENLTSNKDAVTFYLVDFAYENNGTKHYQKIIQTTSLDLRNAGLTAGVDYTISVKVLCKESDVLSSDLAGEVKTLRYLAPQKLTIEDGKLAFDRSSFKNSELASQVVSYAQGDITAQELVDKMYETIYKNPYYFSASSAISGIGVGTGEIRMSVVGGDAISGEEYFITMALKDFIPNFDISNVTLGEVTDQTFFGVLEYVKGLIKNSSEEKPVTITTFINCILSSNQGVGLDEILFDDIGREVPAGNYQISMRQKGGQSGNIDSSYSEISTITVKPAPAVDLIFEESDGEGKNKYIACIATGEEEKYILQMRISGVSLVKFPAIYIVKNESSQWQAMCEGQIIDIIEARENGFGIILNNIKYKLNELEIVTVPDEREISCDIFASETDKLAKSGKFTLCYRQLEGENITFENGLLQLGKGHDLTKKVLLRYRQTGLVEDSAICQGEIIRLSNTGNYDYFIVSLPGEIISNKVYIESDRFMVENAYMLNNPIISSTDNNINIALSSSDKARTEDMTLQISNNKNNSDGKTFKITASGLSYQPGDIDGEVTADKYYFMLNGNSENLSAIKIENQQAEWKLEHSGILVFSSARETFNARMLKGVNLSVQNGQISWTECQDETTKTIVYKVEVKYYSTSSADTDETPKETQVLYTTKTSISADLFKDSLESDVYLSYRLIVTPLSGSLVNVGGVTTIEDEQYSLRETSYFASESLVALRGQKAETLLARGQKITTANADDRYIIGGKIVFTLEESKFMIIAQREGKKFTLQGDYSQYGNVVTFTPKTGEENGGLSEGYNYTLTLYSYNESETLGGGINNVLLSKPLTISSVYKIPEIRESLFDIRFQEESDENRTVLDLSRYFTNASVAGDNSCYQVAIAYKTKSSDTSRISTLTQKTATKYLYIDSWKEIEMVAEASASTQKQLIYSSPVKFKLNSTELYKDVNGVRVCMINPFFQVSRQRFEWTWKDDREGNYEYFVELTYADNTKESATVSDMFYEPSSMGTVTKFRISARQIDSLANRYSFSQVYTLTGEFGLNMFAGGNGTQASPYIISNKEQFLNIAHRNEANSKYYFALSSDLEISQSEMMSDDKFLIDAFNGCLDGRGHKITFTVDKTAQITSTSVQVNNSSSSLTEQSFVYAGALFGRLSKGGEVKGLTISTIVSLESAFAGNAIISPIAVKNYGLIENITEAELTFTSTPNRSSTIFVAGIAGLNYGTISSCSNTASFEITSIPFKFAYAGITLVNSTSESQNGKITGCFNSGNKNFTLSTSNPILHIAGIALSNASVASLIELCGNDGNFTVSMSSSSMKVYGGGIVENQSSGAIKACYSNGLISKTASSNGSVLAGGILYYVSRGTLDSLVSTSMKIEGSSSSKATITNCYGTSGTFSVQILKAVTISYNTSRLIIESSGSGFKARITL